MKNLSFHKDFHLNGNHFVIANDILNYSKTLSPSVYTFLTVWFNKNDYVVVQTSGSTGKSKEIKLKKEHMINSAIATSNYFKLPSKTTALLCLSTDFIAGKMMLVRALALGWHLDIVDVNSNPLEGIRKSYDFSAMIPLQVFNSLTKLSKIKKLIIGGGVVSRELEHKIQNISTECFATYGMTETITHIAVKKLNHNPASFYEVLHNVIISKDKRNCLVINAPNISDQMIITNDLVEIISQTEFKWLGRYDNIINSGGIKLIPEQIELKLSEEIDSRFFVAGVSDKVLGEKLVLIIEGKEDRNILKSQISNLKLLSKFEIPKEVHCIPKFIETETKKIQRQKTLDLIFSNK